VSWCDFADPDGNPLGLYEDLEPVVDLADDVIEPL
jgi:hypothetical protein